MEYMNINNNYSMVGLPHVSRYERNMHQIFEINVINNLEHESIFVQIKSELNYKPISPIRDTIPIQHQPQATPITNGVNDNHNKINKKEPSIIQPVINKSTGVTTDPKPISSRNVYPGFVRIAPFTSLPMPAVISNSIGIGSNDHIVFITVYAETSSKVICLANQLQINRQNIEIKRSENGHIVLQPQNKIDNLLYSWGIPQYLCNSMRNNGWDNISLWHQITETDLIEMGFQRGHRLIFFDKFTEIRRKDKFNSNTKYQFKRIYIKFILQSWNLPIYLHSNMVENGWIDPCDWCEITEHHFKKMGFQDGHIVKFQKEIKNNHHLIIYQKMMSEQKQSENENVDCKTSFEQSVTENEFKQPELIVPLLNNVNNINSHPTFKVYPTTITHEQFEYKLESINPNDNNKKYYLELKYDNNPWKQKEDITDTNRRTICELDMNTTYFIRIRCEDKRTNKITYSQMAEVKTKSEKWKNIHLPKIPDFKYAVSSNNKKITLEFDPKSLIQINQTKFDERYSLDIGLSKDDGLERIVNWKNVATLRKDKLVYKYNVNDQKNADWVHVGISARNDLGQRYNQCTRTRQFPFNQVIKRINTTKHGNNLQFDESMRVATKIEKDYQYSTFAFGQPVTREMCNRYDMYVKVNKLKSDCFMGFAPSLESVIDWNQALGYGGNKNSSVGVLANKLSADFAVYNKDEDTRYIYHAAGGINEKKWDDGSVFVLSFDFLNDDCNIYLNENDNGGNNDHNTLDQNRLLKSIKLNQIKSVVPSFSLNSQGDSIEVVKWRLY